MREPGPKFVGLLLVCTALSCATAGDDRAWPQPRPLGSEHPAYRPPRTATTTDATTSDRPPSPDKTLELTLALRLAQQHDPTLQAASWDVRTAQAEQVQAEAWSNPELELELENFGGQRDLRGVEGAEALLRVSQPLDVWGKGGRRASLAQQQAHNLGWEQESKRLDVVAETCQRFYTVLWAQERTVILGELLELAEQVQQDVTARVTFGKSAPIEQHKAAVAVERTRVELVRALAELRAAKTRLSVAWGERRPRFEQAAGDLTAIGEPPPLDQLLPFLQDNPTALRQQGDVRSLELREQKLFADILPDPELSAGVKRVQELDEYAFVVGLSVPLPLFDRNQGARLANSYALAAAAQSKRATELHLHVELSDAHQQLVAAWQNVQTFGGKILPAAQRAYAMALEGYEAGKYPLLEVLDAQRALFEVRTELVDAQADYHRARIRVERLICRSLVTQVASPASQTGASDES